MTNLGEWWRNHTTLVEVASWAVDVGELADAAEVVYFFEKPWKHEDLWAEWTKRNAETASRGFEVRFKDEGLVNGSPVGPVVVIDLDQYDRDPVLVAHRAKGLPGIPYGHKPLGVVDHSWLTLSEAERIAESYGVELQVS
jgi:hypothetical protein